MPNQSRLMSFLRGVPFESKVAEVLVKPQPLSAIKNGMPPTNTVSTTREKPKQEEVIMSEVEPVVTTKKTIELKADAPVTMTFLSPNLKMRDATIESPEEDITVLGSFDGNIRCRHLFVGPNASVSGRIVVDSARVEGKLAGNIEGSEMYIMKGGTVEGELKCKQLGIQPGSTIRAQIACDVTETIQENVYSNRGNMGPIANQHIEFFPQSTLKPQRAM